MGLQEDLSISPVESTAIGGLSGMIEVAIQQPLISWKNAVQDMRPVHLDPRILYRGVLINAASIAPINGLQFGVNTFLEEKLAVNGELSGGARTGTATLAGAISGVVTCPAELLMIQQQKWGGSLSERFRAVMHQDGVSSLTRGMAPTIVREAVFTGAYLGVVPVMREQLVASWPETFGEKPVTSMVVSSVTAGIAAAVLTQPFDTVKTRMQANLAEPSLRSMARTAHGMWKEGGARVLFRGLLPRAQRVTFAVFILGECQERLTNAYLQFRRPHRSIMALALEKES